MTMICQKTTGANWKNAPNDKNCNNLKHKNKQSSIGLYSKIQNKYPCANTDTSK